MARWSNSGPVLSPFSIGPAWRGQTPVCPGVDDLWPHAISPQTRCSSLQLWRTLLSHPHYGFVSSTVCNWPRDIVFLRSSIDRCTAALTALSRLPGRGGGRSCLLVWLKNRFFKDFFRNTDNMHMRGDYSKARLWNRSDVKIWWSCSALFPSYWPNWRCWVAIVGDCTFSRSTGHPFVRLIMSSPHSGRRLVFPQALMQASSGLRLQDCKIQIAFLFGGLHLDLKSIPKNRIWLRIGLHNASDFCNPIRICNPLLAQ